MSDLRCLSLHQPWASLVAAGVKSIETRSWPTKHRGRIGIASTTARPAVGVYGAWEVFHPSANRWPMRSGATVVELPRGALVATATLIDCVPISPADYTADDDWLGLVSPSGGEEYVRRIHHDDPQGRRGTSYYNEAPYGYYGPGRWAWLLDDVKPTMERCPACWGDTDYPLAFTMEHSHVCPGGGDICDRHCPVPVCVACSGKGSCDPVPVKGRQGLWRWSP